MSKIPFTKMHGAGNDYIYVNTMLHEVTNPSEAAIRWSDRHKGIGSDGLVLIGRSPVPEADFTMRIFNADGSEAMMCGNASRCIGKYLYERGLTDKTEIKLLTLSGVKRLYLTPAPSHVGEERETPRKVNSVTVDMGEPILDDISQYVESLTPGTGTFVSMGNPHYVIFTDDVDQVSETGRALVPVWSLTERYAPVYGSVGAASRWHAAPEPAPRQWRLPSQGMRGASHKS